MAFLGEELIAVRLSVLYAKGELGQMQIILEEQPDAPSMTTAHQRTLVAEAKGATDLALRLAPSLNIAGGIPLGEAIVHASRARNALAAGDRATADAEYAAMGQAITAQGNEMEPDYRQFIDQPARARGFAVVALASDEELERLHRLAERAPLPFVAPYGSSLRLAAAGAALAVGAIAEARRRTEETLTWAKPQGAKLIEAQCHQLLANVLVAEGNTVAAMRKLDAAAQVFGDIGAKHFLDHVIAKKLELQGVGSSDTLTSIDTIAAAVQTEHPDISSQAAPDGTVTLLFSDIMDSTATNERLGGTAWMPLLREHNEVIREQLAANNGYEVKSMGDGFMPAFKSARDGLNCTIAIQRGILTGNDSAGEPVQVRIGLHTGEAVVQ